MQFLTLNNPSAQTGPEHSPQNACAISLHQDYCTPFQVSQRNCKSPNFFKPMFLLAAHLLIFSAIISPFGEKKNKIVSLEEKNPKINV